MKRFLLFILFIFFGTQAFANWRCEVDRCQEYTNCNLNGVKMAYSYKSGGVQWQP